MALYDTLGKEASRFIINQTEMSTIAISNDLIDRICNLKIEDSTMDEKKMTRIVNFITWEGDYTAENKELAEKAGIKLWTF